MMSDSPVKFNLRACTALCTTAAMTLTLHSTSVIAQQFPVKPLRFILGPSSEVLPRILAQRLSTMWGHQVLVDPRPGGGGTVAADTVASLDVHGYTRADFEAFVLRDRARFAKAVKDAGITPE